ncbi:D-xylose transport system substrate-binding protein [Krasilnikovia cinnamomea]|uniref:D-xylose transport system substrate-binding protein n=1 Tax=Krasilnikovia cinnamomea TaxID=349313 RepID=A0A4Q7ZI69_9ACTN|nr:substrate-binding domain-containing protein [Krasilnikovia cinnamomea]RZU49895.1 D-xylose transport system substrate-binding protein [Krasilnikovia cinnamomea]
MRRKLFAFAMVGVLTMGGVVGCTDNGGDNTAGGGDAGNGPKIYGNGKGKIGVILPDTESSQRWGTDDPKFLKAAFDAAGVKADIQNAQGDKAKFASIADSMIAGGATVLMIVNLDSGTGKTVLGKARKAGLATIDYDRLTLNGGADYYVSFNNVTVGQMQGQGLVRCLKEKGTKAPLVADLNGSPTDNNATQFKQGYEQVLQPMYDSQAYVKGPDQSVPEWSNDEAGVIFEQMMAQTQGKIRGVVAANDGLANAAIGVLKKSKLNGVVPVTGQDATVQGLQNILAGDQCMTVYKPIKQEAEAAANLAIKLFKGEKIEVGGKVKDVESGAYVPAVLLKPQLIFKENVKDVVQDKFVDRADVCKDAFEKLCTENGV